MSGHRSFWQRWTAAGLVGPAVAAACALAVLLALATWQLQRKAWKEAIIARIAARVLAPPVAFESLAPSTLQDPDVEYLHVSVSGRLHHEAERYLYAPGQSGLAWQVLTPLEWKPGEIVWVNRGLVPDARRSPDTRAQGQLAGTVAITGLLRHPQRAFFTPANDAKRNVWYLADPVELTRASFPDGAKIAAPLVIEADAAPAPPGGLPAGGVTRLAIPNRHLEYALTWFGLALTLVGVFVAFARARLKVIAK